MELSESGLPTLSTMYGDSLYQRLKEGSHLDDKECELAKRQLSTVYQTRHEWSVFRRNRQLAKIRRMSRIGPALLVTVAATCVSIELATAESTWWRLLASAFAGALGATFSAAVLLRKTNPRMAKLRLFWPSWLVQVALGSVSGVFIFLVLRSGFIRIGVIGPAWAIETTFAFVAGASEPLVLRTMEGLAGIPEFEVGPPPTSSSVERRPSSTRGVTRSNALDGADTERGARPATAPELMPLSRCAASHGYVTRRPDSAIRARHATTLDGPRRHRSTTADRAHTDDTECQRRRHHKAQRTACSCGCNDVTAREAIP